MAEPTLPAAVQAAFSAAFEHHRAGQFDQAERGYRALLNQWPTHVLALSNLGVLLARKGQISEAIRHYTLALAADSNHSDTHYNLGNLLRRANDHVQALASYRECLRIDPGHGNAQFNLGLSCSALGRLEEAEAAFRAVLQIEPESQDARLRLGDVLVRAGRPVEGVQIYRDFVRDFPSDPRGLYNCGLALANDGKAGEAHELLHKALKLRPDYAEAHNALGLTLEMLGRKDDAVFHYERAVALKPDLADAWSNLGTNLIESGRGDEAQTCLRQSLAVRPNAPAVHSNLLLVLNYSSQLSFEQIRDEHLAWGQRFTMPVQPAPPVPPPHDPNRRIRIGYVSADYRQHPVAGLIETLFEHQDRQQWEVFAYPQILRTDSTTERLQSLADHWQPITALSDRQAAEQIQNDGIDVLVDLNGHTAGNRLILFAYRPAPVQMLMFGYPNTTGIPAMDYRVTDPTSDPPGATEHLYSEQLLRLPHTPWVYRAPLDAPPVGPLPGLNKRQFTFGCLNNAAKISDECLNCWAKLIQTILGSKLILLAGGSQAAQKRLTDRFVKAGILRERLQLISRLPRDKYFELYNGIDLALDPFPYNGGVTTCDALWMGVPVLTVAGASYVSRQGVLQLDQIGLTEFIADSPQNSIDLAKMWTNRRPELAQLRGELRDRLQKSPLMDGAGFTANFERAVRQVWQERLPKSEA